MAVQPPPETPGQTFCRECGKPIESDARFCRFCGKPQAERGPAAATPGPVSPPARGPMPAAPRRAASTGAGGLEHRLRQLFPRHHLQDEFMHIATIAAFFMALIGFVLGFFFAYSWLATNFLLGAIALILFLILRESTLSHIRPGGGPATGSAPGGRYQSSRSSAGGPPEAATTQSSPRPPAAPPPASRA